eukprot:UN1466
MDVRFSHDRIRAVFSNGFHAGNDLRSLVVDLDDGNVDAATDPRMTLEVFKFKGALVSLNNRRLRALRVHQANCPQAVVRARVRIHRLDPLTAKFVLSYTTQNEGTEVGVCLGE